MTASQHLQKVLFTTYDKHDQNETITVAKAIPEALKALPTIVLLAGFGAIGAWVFTPIAPVAGALFMATFATLYVIVDIATRILKIDESLSTTTKLLSSIALTSLIAAKLLAVFGLALVSAPTICLFTTITLGAAAIPYAILDVIFPKSRIRA